MLRSMRDLENYSIRATDGDIGRVKDFYFYEDNWVVFRLVIETNTWISNRKVLISPMSMGYPDWGGRILPVKITKEQIKNSPILDTCRSVSQQPKTEGFRHYCHPYYLGKIKVFGARRYLHNMSKEGGEGEIVGLHGNRREHEQNGSHRDNHTGVRICSCKEVIGYHVNAVDGDIGHVHDLLFDEHSWAIQSVVVHTGNWFDNHSVLIAPQWIRNVSSAEKIVSVDLTRKQVKDAPRYDAKEVFSHQEEQSISIHFGRSGLRDSAPKH